MNPNQHNLAGRKQQLNSSVVLKSVSSAGAMKASVKCVTSQWIMEGRGFSMLEVQVI